MKLREYQEKAVESVFNEWNAGCQSTLIVLPTGCGKTICFSEVIKRIHPRRALVIAHREELIWQAKDKIQRHAGLDVEVEMAAYRASSTFWNKQPVVVSTIQTQCSGNEGKGRMTRFNPADYGLVIIDEAHHATADTYKKVLNYYKQNPELRILGVTATPDRADEEALGQVFDSVAYDYEMLDAIHEGWLVPIQQQMVVVEGLDFSAVRTTAGDLNGADLAEIMEAEKNLQGIAASTIDIIGDRRTLVFAASVKQAEHLSEIFNRHKMYMAEWVCGKTPKEERAAILQRFSTGERQIVVNVGVLTEGYDNPAVEVIIQARPTKSRCLYSQMIGRATRPLPGMVDGLETIDQRREAIALSKKPNMLVVDFVGNSGRHKLITTADILGGNVSDEAVERATKKAKDTGQPVRMDELLDFEQRELIAEMEERKRLEAARRAKLVAKASYQSRTINPFDAFQLTPARERGWDQGKQISQKQKDMLLKQGIDPSQMSFAQSTQVIRELFRRWNSNFCSLKQAAILQRHGYDTKEMSLKQASNLIDELKRNGWKRKAVAVEN